MAPSRRRAASRPNMTTPERSWEAPNAWINAKTPPLLLTRAGIAGGNPMAWAAELEVEGRAETEPDVEGRPEADGACNAPKEPLCGLALAET